MSIYIFLSPNLSPNKTLLEIYSQGAFSLFNKESLIMMGKGEVPQKP